MAGTIAVGRLASTPIRKLAMRQVTAVAEMSEVRTSPTQAAQAPPCCSQGTPLRHCPSATQGPPVSERIEELVACVRRKERAG